MGICCYTAYAYCSCSCCSPQCQTITNLVFTIIIIALMLANIIKVSWRDELIDRESKIFFFIPFALIIVGLTITIILIYLRCKNVLNSSKHCLGLTLAIILLIIDMISYILLYIGISFLARDLKDIHDRDRDTKWEYPGTIYMTKESALKDSKILFFLISSIVFMILLTIKICFDDFILISVCRKTDLSNKQEKELEKEKKNVNETMEAVNIYNPSNVQIMNNFQFSGYDKDGKPIYSQSGLNEKITKV